MKVKRFFFIFFLSLFGLRSSLPNSIEAGTEFNSSAYELHTLQKEYAVRIINGEEVRLMIDPEENTPLECRNGCGENGFCFERICYQFPFEKYRIAYGSLVKNQVGELIGCHENCSGKGSYCRENLFGTGICLSALPVCKFVSNEKVVSCSTSEECFNNIQNQTLKEFYRNYYNGSHCTLADVSLKLCCQEDPEKQKCPDQLTPVLLQPKCTEECMGICYNGFCCPDMKNTTRYGSSFFRTMITCDPNKHIEERIPMSGCVDGIVVRFGREHIKRHRTGNTCKLLPNGDFYNGCIETNSTCVSMGNNQFVCVKSNLERASENELNLTPTFEEWVWIQFISFSSSAIFGFWATLFLCGTNVSRGRKKNQKQNVIRSEQNFVEKN